MNARPLYFVIHEFPDGSRSIAGLWQDPEPAETSARMSWGGDPTGPVSTVYRVPAESVAVVGPEDRR